jgi:hypothetical protein
MSDENDNNLNDESLIDKSDLAELDKKDSARISLLNAMGILIGLVALMVFHNIYSIYHMATDDSIPQVMCPRSFDLDRPVILKTLDKADVVDIDNLLKSFALTFTTRLFPRTKEDAQPFFEYIANHTEGIFQKTYEARLAAIDKIRSSIEIGNYSKFYVADSQNLKIRKIDGKESWKIIFTGYLSKRKIGRMQKTQPTIEMTVRYIGAKKHNPEGLIVEGIMFKHIVDPISGEQIEL